MPRKIFPGTTLYTTDSIQTGLRLNLGLRGSVTNYLSHGMSPEIIWLLEKWVLV